MLARRTLWIVRSTGDYREIQPGRCLDFNGSTQYVFYDDAIGVSGSDDRTITFWGRAVDGCGITMGGTGTGEKLSLVQTSAVLRVEVQGGGFTSSLPFPDDEWVFISATFSGTTLAGFRLGVNGVFEQSTGSTTIATVDDRYAFGINNVNSPTYYECKIFDVRIYNRVLTDAEITAIYRQGLQPDSVVAGQPDATNLVGRWLLDDNSETTSYDSSGNGNHGTIVGYANGMLYEGDDVPYSQQNLVGWSNRTNLLSSTYSFTVDWDDVSSSQGSYSNITLSNGQPGIRLECSSQRYYRSKVFSFEAGQYTLKIYAENITGPLSRPVAQVDGYSGSAIYDSSFNAEGWAAKTFTHLGGTSRIRWGIGTDANDSGAIDLTYMTLEKGDTRSTLNPQNCKPNSGFVAGPNIAPRDESDPTNDVLGNPLQYTGTVPKYATPVDAPCLTFNGTTQHVDCGDDPAFDLSTALTVSIWAKNDNALLGGAETLVSKFDYTGNKREWVLSYDPNEKLRVITSSNGTSGSIWTSNNAISIDQLNHIAFTFSSGTLKVYLNGVEVAGTGSVAASIFNSTQPVLIGAENSTIAQRFDGQLFDARIYGTALSADDVVAIYNSTAIDADPVVWLPFSEGDGNRVYDVVNGNSYTITGYASTMWDITQSQFFYSFENGCGDCPNFENADLQEQGVWLIQDNRWDISDGKAVRTDDESGYYNFVQDYPVVGDVTYLISWNQSLTPGSSQSGPISRVVCGLGSSSTVQLGAVKTGVGNVSDSLILTGGDFVGIRARGGTTINSISIQAVDPIAIPALADQSSDVFGNAITGLPGLLNSDSYDLNLLPEPDAPYQRSAIPGATFDGVGDGVAVPTIFWDVNEDWEISTECILPDTSNMGIVGCIRTCAEFGLSIILQTGKYIVRLKLGGYASGVTLFNPAVNMFTPGEWASIHCLYVAATGQVVMTVNGVEYSDTVSAPTNNSRTEYQRQIAVGGRRVVSSPEALYQGTIRYVNVRVGQNKFEYDFRENNGLVIPDRSGNGNDGTLVVNSSLDQFFAPTAFETAYTLGDGRTRPHYVTVDGPNETDFRTEII
jgi:hypothetical protein